MVKAGIPKEKAWWYARYYARMSAYRTEPNRPKDDDGNPVLWHKENGYGRISVDWALFRFEQRAYEVPEDPYLISSTLGQIGVLHADSAGHVILRLDEGYSKQSPEGMVKPTEEYISEEFIKIMTGKK